METNSIKESNVEFKFVNSVIKVAFDNYSPVEFPDFESWEFYKSALESRGFKFTDKNHKVLKIDIYEVNPIVVESNPE